jgi:4-hydroxy-3-polyprenylbenzoate decarboxylase
MIVAPCSMGTAGRIAAGLSDALIERAADVQLKERRPLVLVVRETPLSAIHLENLLRLARAGATVLPASPGFYAKPKAIADLVRFVAERAVAAAGIELARTIEWRGEAPP